MRNYRHLRVQFQDGTSQHYGSVEEEIEMLTYAMEGIANDRMLTHGEKRHKIMKCTAAIRSLNSDDGIPF